MIFLNPFTSLSMWRWWTFGKACCWAYLHL